MKNVLRIVGTVSLLISCTEETPSISSNHPALDLSSGSGITVTATRWVSARTLEADITTALINPFAVNGPHRVRITLPNDYVQNASARYPVLYLLHGGAGGNSAQWTSGGGTAE